MAQVISFPLSADDVKELEGFQAQLQNKSNEAEKNNKVALHNVYVQIMKTTDLKITSAKNRATREEAAARNRRQKEMRKAARAKLQYGATNTAQPIASTTATSTTANVKP